MSFFLEDEYTGGDWSFNNASTGFVGGDIGTFTLTGNSPGFYAFVYDFPLSISSTVVIELTSEQTDLSDDLVSYWNFDSNVVDHQGPNNGSIIGAGSIYESGVFRKGIDLDGASQYINAGNDFLLRLRLKHKQYLLGLESTNFQ